MSDDDKYTKGEAKRLLRKQLRELAAQQARGKRLRARELAAGSDNADFYCLECKGKGKKKGCNTCGSLN